MWDLGYPAQGAATCQVSPKRGPFGRGDCPSPVPPKSLLLQEARLPSVLQPQQWECRGFGVGVLHWHCFARKTVREVKHKPLMQQNAFTEVCVLLIEGQVKALDKHALKGFSTKERTTGRGHLSWPTGKVLQGVLRVATYESALAQQPEASELADLLARVLLSPDLQNTPVGAPRANNFPFHPMLQIWECSKASLALKALLSVLVHDEYKSVIKLNHRTACPRHCLGEWDLMVFVCWLQLCSP